MYMYMCLRMYMYICMCIFIYRGKFLDSFLQVKARLYNVPEGYCFEISLNLLYAQMNSFSQVNI